MRDRLSTAFQERGVTKISIQKPIESDRKWPTLPLFPIPTTNL